MDVINLAHLHLVLNHVPTVGTAVALGLLLLSLVRRNESLKRASLEVFFVIAVLTVPAYLSGITAASSIAGRPGVVEQMIEAHHNAALLAFVLMQATGAAAWLALWQFRRQLGAAHLTSIVVLLLAVLSVALMGRAATLGGEIRHPEIRFDESSEGGAAPLPGTAWLSSYAITEAVNSMPWVWASAETLHFIGLCLSLGVLLLVNLRLLGLMRAIPFAALHRLLPWALLGFGLNLVTGMVFFISASDRYTGNRAFAYKIVFMMIAAANFLYLTVVTRLWGLRPGDAPGLAEKAMAMSSIVLWLGLVYFGRMLPFWPLE
jgi:uncharacterized membrane protein